MVLPVFFSLRTLFKFVKKFEAALNSPSVPSLVEQGSSASLDCVDANPEDTPIHRVHKALKSSLPGKGRDLQVPVFSVSSIAVLPFSMQHHPILSSNAVYGDEQMSESAKLNWEFQQEDPEEGVEASSLLGRLPVLTRKMKKLCIQLLKKHPVPELAEDLDCFTGKNPSCEYYMLKCNGWA